MPKNILITGCSGFVASNLIKFLENKKYKIKCISRNRSNKNIIEYSNKEKIKESIKESDVIVHLAAIINPFDKDIWKVNVEYSQFLVTEAKKWNKKLVYISTQNVLFGKDNYSKSKRKAESIVKKLKNFVILRPTIIYGKNEDRYIGKLVNVIKSYPLMPIIGNGKNILQPIYIGDLTKIIENCIKKNVKGTFLVAGKSPITYNELVDLIIKKLGVKRIKLHIPIWAVRPFSRLIQKLMKTPPINTVQLDNLKINKVYDIKVIEKTFDVKLMSIEEGLDIITKNE